MVIKKGTCLFFLSPYFWRYIAIIIAIKVIAIRCEPMAIIFTDFSKNLCFSDNSIHTKNSHRHRFIAIIMAIKSIAIRSEPTLSCLYAKFRWLISHVLLSFQPLSVNVLPHKSDSGIPLLPNFCVENP